MGRLVRRLSIELHLFTQLTGGVGPDVPTKVQDHSCGETTLMCTGRLMVCTRVAIGIS